MKRGKPAFEELEARLGHVFADPDFAERALTHVSAPHVRRSSRRAHPTSGWSSSATGCWASSSPRCSTRRFPRRPRAISRSGWRGWCGARPARKWRKAGTSGRMIVHGRRRGARRRAQEGGHSRRRLRGADRRRVSRRRFPRRSRRWCAATGISGCAPTPIRSRTPRPPCRNGRKRVGFRRPSTARSSARGPPICRVSSCKWSWRAIAPERGEATSKRAAEQAAAKTFLERWASP